MVAIDRVRGLAQVFGRGDKVEAAAKRFDEVFNSRYNELAEKMEGCPSGLW